MRACAQVREIALLIEGDNSVLRQIVYKLDLVRLLALFHELYRLLAGQLKALKLYLLLADLAHLGLYLLEYLGGDGKGRVKIVVKPVFDSGADGQLHLGVEALHRLS